MRTPQPGGPTSDCGARVSARALASMCSCAREHPGELTPQLPSTFGVRCSTFGVRCWPSDGTPGPLAAQTGRVEAMRRRKPATAGVGGSTTSSRLFQPVEARQTRCRRSSRDVGLRLITGGFEGRDEFEHANAKVGGSRKRVNEAPPRIRPGRCSVGAGRRFRAASAPFPLGDAP